MKGMNNPTDQLANKIHLSLEKGAYLVSATGKRTRIRVNKKTPVYENGSFTGRYDERPLAIPVTSVVVTLVHPSGDTVTWKFRKMGSKESVTKTSTGQPPTQVRTKLATGPELVTVGGKPISTNVNKAAAEIDRMTRMGWKEARRLFNIDLLEAGVVQ
jgi:hypothetical protein